MSDKNYITEIWPNSNFDLARKLNAITRIIIIMAILGYFLTKSPYIPISAVVSLIVLVIIYKSKGKDSIKEGFKSEFLEPDKELNKILQKEFTMPTKKNPVMNVLMNEYKENPHELIAKSKVITEQVEKEIYEPIN